MHRGVWVQGRSIASLCLLSALGLGAAPSNPPQPPAQSPAPRATPSPAPAGGAPAKVRFAPQARDGSTYKIDARVQIVTKDVTFEAPPAYAEGFNFWSSRMKGVEKNELYQFLTVTDDRTAEGLVPFRKQVSRFQVEIVQRGETLAAMSDAVRDMPDQVWQGMLDPFGNVREIRRVAGGDDADMKELATPYAVALFPPGDAPGDLSVSESIRTTSRLPLPSRLHIDGLEAIGVLMTRELKLKRVDADRATLEVKTTFANDPETKPGRPDTTCTIGGSGVGEAVFDLKRGVYESTRQPSTMTIDLTAPLKRLPQMPETVDPGNGKSHIVLDLLLSGTQDVHRVIGED